MRSLKRKARNKAAIEGSIVEAYLVQEMSTFCSHYFEVNIPTWLNRVPQNDDIPIPVADVEGQLLSIFNTRCRNIPNCGRQRLLDPTEKHQMHIYTLRNCNEIIPIVR